MKNLKKLKRETNEILNKTKDTHYDEFTQVNEYQMKLEKYYDENDKNYDNETLLQMYNHVSREKKILFDNLNAIISGIIGGFVVELIKDFEELPNKLISVGILIVLSLIIVLFIIKYILSIPQNDPSYISCFFDKVHANILKKILKERGFCIFNGD